LVNVESIECPKCGAAVKGTGRVTCQFCGASLVVAVPAGEAERVALPEVMVGADGVRVKLDPNALHFGALPDLLVTRELADVPFKPLVLYENAMQSVPAALRDDGAAVVDVIRRGQKAVNAKSADLLLSLLSTRDPAFVKAAAAAAAKAFAAGDPKRFTATINFHRLKHDRAEAGVISETFTFGIGGQISHEAAAYGWHFRKEPEGWKVSDITTVGKRVLKGVVFGFF